MKRTDIRHKVVTMLFVQKRFYSVTASQSIFITEIQNSIESALDYTPHVILTGDMNIDFSNLKN